MLLILLIIKSEKSLTEGSGGVDFYPIIYPALTFLLNQSSIHKFMHKTQDLSFIEDITLKEVNQPLPYFVFMREGIYDYRVFHPFFK